MWKSVQINLDDKRVSIGLLRIISIMGVVLIHSGIYISYHDNVLKYVSQGQMGLWLFMAISGYLISVSLHNNSFNIKVYFEKRFIRIVPLYYTWLIVMMVVGKLTGWWSFSNWDWFRQFIFADLIIPTSHFNGFWALGSLSSFFTFYMFAPILVKVIDTVDKSLFAIFIGVMLRLVVGQIISTVIQSTGYFDPRTFSDNTPLSTIVFFLVGLSVYNIEISNDEKNVIKFLLYMFVFWMIAFIASDVKIRVIFSTGLILGAFIFFPIKYPTIIKRIIHKLSPYTFPLYICHFSMFDIVKNVGGDVCLYIVAPILVAIFIHWLIEVPSTVLLKKFFKMQ